MAAAPMFGVLAAGRLVRTDAQIISPTHCVFSVSSAPRLPDHVAVFLTGNAPLPEGFGAGVHIGWPRSPVPGAGAFPHAPGPEPDYAWRFLGVITNDKPSAIFRLRAQVSALASLSLPGGHPDSGMVLDADGAPSGIGVGSSVFSSSHSPNNAGGPAADVPMLIGLSIEPLGALEAQVCALPRPGAGAAPAQPHNALVLASAASAGASPTAAGGLPPHQQVASSAAIAQNLADHLVNYVTSFVGSGPGVDPQAAAMGAAATRLIQDWRGSVDRRLRTDPEYFSRLHE
ncbi:hypothetical protein H696_02374 [Fonticula alba]|uniref:Uncharacterized protein n=1 Tax=Fonticula alba TaxID=691883 RepID=A0A058ZBX1_FONAL|nr:hypothetical protein H696_02374 [Fonticula alba]KCV71426.1 hypothetical protein H696_02374 [Fonticula alba]|eukprot:XP_009494549.1 hypothetical protein H696_02374 [Fonticula alba]